MLWLQILKQAGYSILTTPEADVTVEACWVRSAWTHTGTNDTCIGENKGMMASAAAVQSLEVNQHGQ